MGNGRDSRTFTFDNVFGEDSKQKEVFQKYNKHKVINHALDVPRILFCAASKGTIQLSWLTAKLDLERPIRWVLRCKWVSTPRLVA